MDDRIDPQKLISEDRMLEGVPVLKYTVHAGLLQYLLHQLWKPLFAIIDDNLKKSGNLKTELGIEITEFEYFEELHKKDKEATCFSKNNKGCGFGLTKQAERGYTGRQRDQLSHIQFKNARSRCLLSFELHLQTSLYWSVRTLRSADLEFTCLGLPEHQYSARWTCVIKWISMCTTGIELWDTVQLETAVTTISQEYLLEFTSEYGISEALHPKLPGPEDMIVDFPEGKQEAREKYPAMLYQALRFSKKLEQPLLLVDERVFPTIVDWRMSAPKDGMSAENTYSPEAVIILNTHRTPIQKQPEALLCLVGLSSRYYLRDEVYPTFLHDDDRDIDLFSLIRAPNPTKVKTGSRPRAAHEVPLLTVTANRVIEMEDPATATDSSGVPSTIERFPLDFSHEDLSQHLPEQEDQEVTVLEVPPPENVTTTGVAPEAGQVERVAATNPLVVKKCRRRGHDGFDTNAPLKVLRRDHADPRPTESTRGGKSLTAIELGMGSTRPASASQGASVDVSDPGPLSFAGPQTRPSAVVTQGLLRPEIQTHRIHHLPPWSGLLRAYTGLNGVQLRFEQEAKLLKKSVAQVARRDKRIQAKENEIKNLETLLEAEADMKKAAENKSADLSIACYSKMQKIVNLKHEKARKTSMENETVSTLQEQIIREENLTAAFEEFKQYENNRVEQRCAKMDTHLDALSIDFDEELYPHMLTAIAGHRWMIGRGLRLAVMKYGKSTELRQAFTDVVSAGIAKGMSEGLKHEVEHGKAKLDLEAIEAYDPEVEAKYIAILHALKNMKYPLVDQLESLKDAPMDVIMASLHLESDTGDDVPQWIRELQILLADAIAANVSRAKKKKKCRVVCRTLGVGSAHHARSDGVLVSVPTVAPQGLAILLADAATQTETSDEASPRLLRSSSLPVIHG
nr:transposase (putative), gypsy type [Tanacetum cinerariifolium]